MVLTVFISFYLLIYSGFMFQVQGTKGHHPNLLYFETLHKSHLRFRVKRDTRMAILDTYQEVRIPGFGREFHLELERSNLLASDFVTDIIDKEGGIRSVPLHTRHFYHGKVKGEDNSSCTLFVDDGMLMSTISLGSEEYFIEPAWRHFEGEKDSMIFYRSTDVAYRGNRSCNIPLKRQRPVLEEENNKEQNNVKHRNKRATLTGEKVCRLKIVADYYFFSNIGAGSYYSTQTYLIGVLAKVNQIYSDTDWSNDNTYLGFQIARMEIHEEFTNKPGHYNARDRTSDPNLVLESFSKSNIRNGFCLVHLFTYQSYVNVLGLAYQASVRNTDVGGACDGANIYGQAWNTGMSTFMDQAGQRQLAVVSMGTVAHAHGLGSPHDPDNNECMPSDDAGGKYLMYEHSLSAELHNHYKFSSCSRNYIREVLAVKGYCLQERSKYISLCGNGRLEAGEQCDSGQHGDDCCENCRLKLGADCSPLNLACCTADCKLAPANTRCYITEDDSTSCKEQAVCNGYEYECPAPSFKQNGTDCIDGGKCYSGECVNFCEVHGLLPCACSEPDYACRRCCKVSPTSQCVPYQSFLLQDGRPCYQGYCQQGQCIKTYPGVLKEWAAIKLYGIDYIGIFMKNNIILFVSLFSGIVYVPIAIVRCCRDGKCQCCQCCKREKDEEPVELRNVNPFV